MTPSMRHALTDLELDRLLVVYPGVKAYPLSDKVAVVPLAAFAQNGTYVLPGGRGRARGASSPGA